MTELEQAYRTLGLEPGASFREVMEAHSDLVTVWDPKRFAGSPRLERKALHELNSINQAFELIRSQLPQKTGVVPPAASPASNRPPVRRAITEEQDSVRRSTSGSLYESTLERDGRSRSAVWIILAVAAAAIIILLLLISGGEDSSKAISEAIEEPPSQASDQSGAPRSHSGETRDRQESAEAPAPAGGGVSGETRGGDQAASARPAGSVEPAEPIRRAFDLLQARSPVARALVEQGAYQDLEFVKWEVVRARVPEIAIDVAARKRGDDSEVHLIWAVNLETQTIRPTSEALVELLNRDSGPKPALVREF